MDGYGWLWMEGAIRALSCLPAISIYPYMMDGPASLYQKPCPLYSDMKTRLVRSSTAVVGYERERESRN